jgi:hypothetical protein
MMLEIWNRVEETMNYYRNVSDFPFNFRFITEMYSGSNGKQAEAAILGWMNNLPEPDSWPNWVASFYSNLYLDSVFIAIFVKL